MHRKINFTLLCCFFLISGIIFSSCTKQEILPNATEFSGVYTLVSVNDNAVPATVSHQGVNMEVLSGSFIINSDGTCSSKTIFVPPSGTEAVREVSATYTKENSQLTMQWKGAGQTLGTIHDKTFTMDNEGMIFLYKK